MAVTAQEIRQSYPLPVYNYRVEIGADAIAFSEVSGLSIGYEVATYKESQTGGGAPGPDFPKERSGGLSCLRLLQILPAAHFGRFSAAAGRMVC